jgi:uncharacterized protein (DUF927 family)
MLRLYDMRPDGLYKKNENEQEKPMWLSGPFAIEAETRDHEGRSWGVLFSWYDRDGMRHEEMFPRSSFSSDSAEARSRFADGGLPMNAMPPARQAFTNYLGICKSEMRARSVSMTGWHKIDGTNIYVLPDRVYGDIAERIVLQRTERALSLFNSSGTLAEWNAEVARPCLGNSRLLFAVCCAFAAPLLGLLGEDGGGFNLRGTSSIGKSTAQGVAASVCGGTSEKGANGFIRSWRTTGNGLEAVAVAHSDGLLLLDEMSQVDGRELGEIAYMLANGQGKSRATRNGGERQALRFRVLFLSSGELSLAEKMAEAGQTARAGQEIRVLDVPADAGAGMGMFECLPDGIDAVTFAEELGQAVGGQYGTAFPAFLTWLTRELQARGDFVDHLRQLVSDLRRAWLQGVPDAGSQVGRAAFRFAILGVAGELASKAGIIEWPADAASTAAETCFRAWLEGRGTSGQAEDAQAVRQLVAFISRHGQARFEVWKDKLFDDAQQAAPSSPPREHYPTQNRAGWRRFEDGKWRFYMTAEGLKEAMVGLAPRESARTLARLGYIVPSQAGSDMRRNVLTGSHNVPPYGKVRLYELRPDILDGGEGGPIANVD